MLWKKIKRAEVWEVLEEDDLARVRREGLTAEVAQGQCLARVLWRKEVRRPGWERAWYV